MDRWNPTAGAHGSTKLYYAYIVDILAGTAVVIIADSFKPWCAPSAWLAYHRAADKQSSGVPIRLPVKFCEASS